MAVAGLAAALYTYMNTPALSGIPIYFGPKFQHMESKEVYIFSYLVFQLGIFLMLAIPALRWRRFIDKSVERERYWVAQFSLLGDVNIAELYKVVCIGLCLMGAWVLFETLYRCYDLLAKY